MNDFYKDQYLNHHKNFMGQLKIIFPAQDTIDILNSIGQTSDEIKITRAQLFSSSLKDENFELFIKNKIKVFSHKSSETQTISESLFGPEFCLKNLLNNQPDDVKNIIWTNLHTTCLFGELLKPEDVQDETKIKTLNKLIYKSRGLADEEPKQTTSEHKSKLQDMLGVDVNNQTTSMIDDIVESFEKVLTGQSANSNPLSGIMEISQKISVKYADKINNGEIELDKIMKAITSKVPGMEEMMSGMMGGDNKKKQPKEKILIDENFSTANVEVGLNKEEESKSFNIANVLKIADQFGVIPGGKQASEGGMGEMDGIPGIGKMMELMSKLEKTETQEEAEALKQEMDSFLQNEMGVDVEKLNAQLEQQTNLMKENKTD